MKTAKQFLKVVMVIFVLAAMPLLAAANHHPKAHPRGHVMNARFIYYPAYNMYFDLRQNVYLYEFRGHWVANRRLPRGLHAQEVRHAYAVAIPVRGDHPYYWNHEHQRRYVVRHQPRPQRRAY